MSEFISSHSTTKKTDSKRTTFFSVNHLVSESEKRFRYLESLEDKKSYTFPSNNAELHKK